MLFYVAFLLLLSFVCIIAQDYHVIKFGAKGDGVTDDSGAVRAAFAAANNTQGGRVIFDAGYTFLTGSFVIGSNTILDARGVILGSTDPECYTW